MKISRLDIRLSGVKCIDASFKTVPNPIFGLMQVISSSYGFGYSHLPRIAYLLEQEKNI